MKGTLLILLATLIFVSHSAHAIVQTTESLSVGIESEKNLADLLLGLLGQNSEKISQSIKNFLHANHISVMNAAEKLDLLFVYLEGQELIKGFQLTKDFVQSMGSHFDKLNVHYLVAKSAEEVKQYVDSNLKESRYQQINVNREEIQQIRHLLTPHQRLLEQVIQPVPSQTPTQSFSYITKFFFIILFLLVTFGILGSIASMENRKDSLLYAKFLTDVSGR